MSCNIQNIRRDIIAGPRYNWECETHDQKGRGYGTLEESNEDGWDHVNEMEAEPCPTEA